MQSSEDFPVLSPGKEGVSVKLKRNESSPSSQRKESKKLDIDNKQMEWRLHQLKQTMEKEKEDRGKQGYIWKSSKTEALDSHARNILGRSVKSKSGKKKDRSVEPRTKDRSAEPRPRAPEAKPKITVLKDEPLEMPKRNPGSRSLYEALMMNDPDLSNHQHKDKEISPNRESWIQVALDRSSEEVLEVRSDTDGNLPLVSLQAIEPRAIGLFFVKWGRKRLLPAVDGNILRPKVGWGQDVYFPYIGSTAIQQPANDVITPPKFHLPAELTTSNKKKKSSSPAPSRRDASRSETARSETARSEISHREGSSMGGQLFQGKFDEDESAKSFQQALKNWRQTAPPRDNQTKVEETDKGSNVSLVFKGKEGGKEGKNIGTDGQQTGPPEMSVHAVQSDPVPIDINFTQTSTLSYMERVLLKRHRETDVPPLPVPHEHTPDHVTGDYDDDDDGQVHFTAEEEEDRQRIHGMFTPLPPPADHMYDDDADARGRCVVTELFSDEDVDDDDQPTSYCVVEHASDGDDVIGDVRSRSRVRIEEAPFEPSRSSDVIVRSSPEVPTTNAVRPVTGARTAKPRTVVDRTGEAMTDVLHSSPTPPRSARGPVHPACGPVHPSAGRRSGRERRYKVKTPDRRSAEPGALLSAVSRLPIDPDAFYNRGLDQFFSPADDDDVIPRHTGSDARTAESEDDVMLLNRGGGEGTWRPTHSFVDFLRTSIDTSPEATGSDVIARVAATPSARHAPHEPSVPVNGDQSRGIAQQSRGIAQQPGGIAQQSSGIAQQSSGIAQQSSGIAQQMSDETMDESLVLAADYEDTSLEEVENVIEREKQDEETLHDLEWELASRTGNITEDGRISRLIDDWSDDNQSEGEDLGIINDDGLGSGLSTPEDIEHLSLNDDDDHHQHQHQSRVLTAHAHWSGNTKSTNDQDTPSTDTDTHWSGTKSSEGRVRWSGTEAEDLDRMEKFMMGSVDSEDDDM